MSLYTMLFYCYGDPLALRFLTHSRPPRRSAALPACCALRLARFTTALLEESPAAPASRSFVGVPAPAAAGLAVLPIALSLVFGDGWLRSDPVSILVLLAVALLMKIGRAHV